MVKKNSLTKIPAHVAIIMDGNGRWAKKRLLSKKAGHQAGAQALKNLIVEVEKLGVSYLSVYAFSTENWNRPQKEIDDLMDLLQNYIQQYIDDAQKNAMRVSVIGRRDRLDPNLQKKILYLEDLTKDKPGLHLIIALDYGGRDEILRAIKKFLSETTNPNELTEKKFSRCLDTAPLPDPDLLIRTSGEQRISNFLLWQLAYTELVYCDKLWPDFTIDDFCDALEQYAGRIRRFGARKEN